MRLVIRLGTALAAALAQAAAAHDGTAASPGAFEPWIVLPLAASALLYALGLARLWRRAGRGRGVTAGAAARFALGWLALAAALVTPLDALGARLFSAHMVQHELLMVVAAPLMVTGRPLEAWTWALPPAARRAFGAFFHRPAWHACWSLLTAPLAAWLLHAAALWAWHVPALFQAALVREGLHTLQHASFLATALLFWWAALGGPARRPDAASLASLFTTMLHTGALGALLTFAPRPWYPAYAETARYGLTALEDQQLGGLVMWVPGGTAYLVAALAIAGAWLAAGPREAVRSSPAAACAVAAETRDPARRGRRHPA